MVPLETLQQKLKHIKITEKQSHLKLEGNPEPYSNQFWW